ncbi:MAG: hypothetical protein AAGH15_10610 [Myxococcota bacterium]
MRSLTSLFGSAFALLALAACGDDPEVTIPAGDPRCDVRDAESLCIEYTGADYVTDNLLVLETEEACVVNGMWTHEETNTACSTVNAVARCERGAGTGRSTFTYYYRDGAMPYDLTSAMAACTDGTVVAF